MTRQLRGLLLNPDKLPKGIEKMRIFARTVDYTLSALRYAKAMERAREVHVMDSLYLHLYEQLEPTGELYFHRYVRANGPMVLNASGE